MKIILILSILLFIIGHFLQYKLIPGGLFINFISIISLFICSIILSFKNYKRENILQSIILLFTILTSIILATKYLYHSFLDYPALFILPIFYSLSVIYFIKVKSKEFNTSILIIGIILISLPVLYSNYPSSPRNLVPHDWYTSSYNETNLVGIVNFEYEFKTDEGTELFLKAFETQKIGDYENAVKLYYQILEIEKNPKVYFQLAECFAQTNDLEKSISSLNLAIEIDSSNHNFWFQKGYYEVLVENYSSAIESYNKAISLNSSNKYFFMNIALAYFYNDQKEEACNAIKIYQDKGGDVNELWELEKIDKKYCNFITQELKTIKIGSQEWSTKNIDVFTFRNGDSIPEAKSDSAWKKAWEQQTPAWCYYNNDPKLGGIYGKLYNWYAVNDPRGLLEEGYHVPSKAEWDSLVSNLGGRELAGMKLKNLEGWFSSGNGDNKSRFSGLPGGLRNGIGDFEDIGKNSYWWTTTEVASLRIFYYTLAYDQNGVGRSHYVKGFGLSVRSLKDK